MHESEFSGINATLPDEPTHRSMDTVGSNQLSIQHDSGFNDLSAGAKMLSTDHMIDKENSSPQPHLRYLEEQNKNFQSSFFFFAQ